MEMPEVVPWHPLGPETKPEPKPAPSRYPDVAKVIGKDDYAQFARNVDITPDDFLGLLSGDISEYTIKARRNEIVFNQRVARFMKVLVDVPTHRLLDRYRSRLWNHYGRYDRETYDLQDIEGQALKNILDTREHIPRHSRGPGKLRRQTLARAARGQNKSKNR